MGWSAAQTLWIGGGFVEPFAYGSPASVEAPQNNLVSLPMPPPPWTLADPSGISSEAFAGFAGQKHLDGLIDEIDKLVPKTCYWSVKTTGTSETTNFSFGYGGVMENYGLIPLMATKSGNHHRICQHGFTA